MTDIEVTALAADYIAADWDHDRYYRDMNLIAFTREVERRAIAAECEANRTALNVANGALLMCTPCAAPDCAQEQREWLDDAMRCIDRRLAALPHPSQPQHPGNRP